MLGVGGGLGLENPCIVRSHVQGGPGPGDGFLYSEVQCIMGNAHMGPQPVNRHTRPKTLPSRNFVGG